MKRAQVTVKAAVDGEGGVKVHDEWVFICRKKVVLEKVVRGGCR